MLIVAIRGRNEDAVEELCMAGVDVNIPNRKGITPISAAAHKGRAAILQMLIDAGALVNAVNSSGSAPLIQAAHFGHQDCVQLLLDHGANPDFANTKGTTALMRAAQEGYGGICLLLLQSQIGVHVNRKNYEGMNALMLGSQRGHAETVKVLIDYHANMDERTAQGSTALMLACKRGNVEVVRVLVSMGAEICVRDIHGRTASDTAIKYHQHFLLDLLSTQVQLSLVREAKRLQRSEDLLMLRDAFNLQRLAVAPEGQLAIDRYKTDRAGRSLLQTTPVSKSAATHLCARRPLHQEWHWVVLLYKAFALPMGLFEYIVDYLPAPPMARWHLMRMSRRCELAPQVTVQDLSVFMDEVLADACVFKGPQTGLLVSVSRDPSAQAYMLEHGVVDSEHVTDMVTWSDVQSILARVGEAEVAFKASFVARFFAAALSLYKHMRNQASFLHVQKVERDMAVEAEVLTKAFDSVLSGVIDIGAEAEAGHGEGGTWISRGGSGSFEAGAGLTGMGADDMEDDSDAENQHEGEAESVHIGQLDALFSDDEEEEVQLAPMVFAFSGGGSGIPLMRRCSSASASKATCSVDPIMSSQYQSVLQQRLHRGSSGNADFTESFSDTGEV